MQPERDAEVYLSSACNQKETQRYTYRQYAARKRRRGIPIVSMQPERDAEVYLSSICSQKETQRYTYRQHATRKRRRGIPIVNMQPERDAEVYLSSICSQKETQRYTYRQHAVRKRHIYDRSTCSQKETHQHAARHIGTPIINRLPDRHIGISITKEGTKDGAVTLFGVIERDLVPTRVCPRDRTSHTGFLSLLLLFSESGVNYQIHKTTFQMLFGFPCKPKRLC